MDQISLRDFQLKPTSFLSKLPLQLTRYGFPIAEIFPIQAQKDKISVNTPPLKVKSVNTPSVKINPTKEKPLRLNSFQLCPKHKVYRINCSCT